MGKKSEIFWDDSPVRKRERENFFVCVDISLPYLRILSLKWVLLNLCLLFRNKDYRLWHFKPKVKHTIQVDMYLLNLYIYYYLTILSMLYEVEKNFMNLFLL